MERIWVECWLQVNYEPGVLPEKWHSLFRCGEDSVIPDMVVPNPYRDYRIVKLTIHEEVIQNCSHKE